MEFMLYPTTVKMLAAEIITVCDAYISRKIRVEDLKKVIAWFMIKNIECFWSAL